MAGVSLVSGITCYVQQVGRVTSAAVVSGFCGGSCSVCHPMEVVCVTARGDGMCHPMQMGSVSSHADGACVIPCRWGMCIAR